MVALRFRSMVVVTTGLLALGSVNPTAAQTTPVDAETTPADVQTAPPLLGAKPPKAWASPRAPRSLATLAAGVRLTPVDSGEAIVVTDLNLRQVAADGRISLTTGVSAELPSRQSVPTAQTPQEEQEDPVATWEKSYQDQVKAIDKAQQRLEAREQAAAQANNPYMYGYPPGVVPPSVARRDEAAQELERRRQELERLRQHGRRLGVSPGWYRQQGGGG